MSARHRLLLPAAAILFGLTACDALPVSAPLSSAPPSSAPASAAAAPTSAAAAPTSAETAPTSAASATSRAGATEASNHKAGGVKCPSAKTLEKVAPLPKGWYFVPSSVECWKGWATADPEGPTPGDGIYLFHYKPGVGWRYHSQGSGYDCKDLGIHEPSPFCQYP